MEHIFWAEECRDGICLSKGEANHLSVLRINLPAKILFTFGDGSLYSGTADVNGRIISHSKIESSKKTLINIYFGVCDKIRIKYILEKCTELGADSFTPVLTERSEKFSLNNERAKKIIVSALKQSRRFGMPE
jgi:16S rRNA (uracil1498-N3)-methyltransferase